ncbi:MAG TPA: two-component regulator propeller domain-containing protein [Chitinophagaceae bacterium]
MKWIIVFSRIVLLLAISHYGVSQNNTLKFNLVEVPGGKPLGKIRNIVQDLHGYMWFSGEGERCIYRYDGIRFTVFRHDDNNQNSLGGTTVNSVYGDDAGMIWIGMNTGLDQFNPSTGIFKHYKRVQNDSGSLGLSDVAPILKDRQGRVWVGGSQGLDRLDEKTGKFIHYRNQPANKKSLSSNYVWCIYEDRQGIIWIGTGYPWSDSEDGGLNRLEADGTFTRFMHDPDNPNSLINNKIAAIFEDNRGIFWVGTSGNGLHTMDRKTGIFERHLYDPKKPDQLSRPPLNVAGGFFDKINFIIEDSTGSIWIGTQQSGINRYDPVTKKITYLMHSNGFPDSSGWNAFTSRDGEVWITTEQRNLYRTNPFYKPILSIPTANLATNFLEDKKGNLWVSTTGNGLLKFDQYKNLERQYKHDPLDSFSLLDDNVGEMFPYQDNVFLVNSYNGIRVFNSATNKFSKFSLAGPFRDALDTGFVKAFLDKHGIMWFARWGLGLVRYDPKDNSTKQFFHNSEDSTSIGSNHLNSILEDRSGELWIAGDGGINRLNRQTHQFVHYLKETFITYLYEDSQGNLLAGSAKGLYQYNPKEDRFTGFFDPQSELNSAFVGGIIEDNAKNLWLTSPSAIIKLNPVTKETFNYGSRFGVNPNSLAPYTRTYKNEKGQLFIGYDKGFYILSPEELAAEKDFKIVITDLFINTHFVLPGKESPVQKSIEDITDLHLKYNQNNIAFNFAAIDYDAPEMIKYFTMLEGYDNIWREVKGEKNSAYFNLSRGKYIYRVKAFNSDGTRAEKAITIRINPPWWETWWAYTLYAILFITAIWFFISWRTRSLKKEKINLEQKVADRTKELKEEKEIVESTLAELRSTQAQLIQSEKMASLGELTAGIAHEIQNPLNFVNNFSDVNAELVEELQQEADRGNLDEVKAIAKDIKDNEQKINHHGKRADAIVKGMLQHSRTSSGQKEPTDINALCDEYLRLAYHGLRAKDKSFNATTKTDFDTSIGNVNIVAQDVGRVILNLINNAFYAVCEKQKQNIAGYEPTVQIKTTLNPPSGGRGAVEIRVKDNGNGIPQKVMDKIFQPFFTTKPTGQGTGLGLSLSYDIVKAHGGELKVETKENEGSEFIVQLPVR